ncbi:hypothetical protein BD408DRAFT_412328 [Parasitella parasitica]|nr:hypothetical protein BD408DRAFT_412328 [Parasitella parasitica]
MDRKHVGPAWNFLELNVAIVFIYGIMATSIVLGTTRNDAVAETKTEDVMGSRRKKL